MILVSIPGSGWPSSSVTVTLPFGWTGLTSGLQDLKDFARQSGLDVVYSEVGRERDPSGTGKGSVFHIGPR